MEPHEYKYIFSLSSDKVLRQVSDHERQGWFLYLLQPGHFFFLGSGGSAGLHAVMRRIVRMEPQTKSEV